MLCAAASVRDEANCVPSVCCYSGRYVCETTDKLEATEVQWSFVLCLRVRELALRLSSEEVEKSSSGLAVKAAQRPSPAALPPVYPAPASTPSPKRKHVIELLGRMNERMDHKLWRRGAGDRAGETTCAATVVSSQDFLRVSGGL